MSHFTVENLNGHIIITEVQVSNLAKTQVYSGPRARQGYSKCNNGSGIRIELIDDAAWKRAVQIIQDPELVIQKIKGWRQEGQKKNWKALWFMAGLSNCN